MNSQKTSITVQADMNDQLEQLREAEETIERLKRELDFARQDSKRSIQDARENELNNYRLELESIKKKNDLNHLRIQAEEVAKRRKLEKEIIKLKGELQAAKQEMSRYQLELEEVKQALSEEKEKTRLEAQEEIAGIRMQAKEAWRHAEDETARLDGEVAKLKQRLENEKAHRAQAEKTILKLESVIAKQRQTDTAISESDQLDKRHFDKLLKKAHLAIKNLQEKLNLSNTERDDYLKELTEIRSQLIEHKLDDILKESSSEAQRREEKTRKQDNVTYRAGAFTKNRPDGLKRPLPSPPPPVNLDQPIFDDDFSDELLLVEPDTSFDQNQDDQFETLSPEKKRPKRPSAQTKDTDSRDHEEESLSFSKPDARMTGLHSSIEETLDEILEDDDLFEEDDADLSEITRELLQESSPSRPSQKRKSQRPDSFVSSPEERASQPYYQEQSPKRNLLLTLFVCTLLVGTGGYGIWWLKNHDFSNERLAASPTYRKLMEKRGAQQEPVATTATPGSSSTPPAVEKPATKPKPVAVRPQPAPRPKPVAVKPDPKPAPVPVETASPDAPQNASTATQAQPSRQTEPFTAVSIPEQTTGTEDKVSSPAPASQPQNDKATAPSVQPAKPEPLSQQQLEQQIQERLAQEQLLREQAEKELEEGIKNLDPVRSVIQ